MKSDSKRDIVFLGGKNMKTINEKTLGILRKMQTDEINEYYVYTALAKRMKESDPNRKILERIGLDEKGHSEIWGRYTGLPSTPKKAYVYFFSFLSRIFGFTFALKLMEKGEDSANDAYAAIADEVPEARIIAAEEDAHEQELLKMLDEERLQYVGSMVFGLNDALVELSGTLAGLTFALQNNKIIALSGLITGISATLSMMSSEYLSSRSEGAEHPLKAASYTGIMYIVAVTLMTLPYLLFPVDQFLPALVTMLLIVILIIFVFTYYVSVAQDLPFKKRFIEMATISMSVAAVAFLIGIVVKQFLGIQI